MVNIGEITKMNTFSLAEIRKAMRNIKKNYASWGTIPLDLLNLYKKLVILEMDMIEELKGIERQRLNDEIRIQFKDLLNDD